jgi:hypothetical protein
MGTPGRGTVVLLGMIDRLFLSAVLSAVKMLLGHWEVSTADERADGRLCVGAFVFPFHRASSFHPQPFCFFSLGFCFIRCYGLSMRLIENMKLDKSSFEVSNINDDAPENGWMSKTPLERFEGVEILRQMWHSYDPDTERLPRVYTVVER